MPAIQTVCSFFFFNLFYEDGSLINRMHRCVLKWYILFMSVPPILYFIKNTETCAWSIQSERTQVSQELSQKLKKSPLENKKPDGKNAQASRSHLTSFKMKMKKKRKFTANENERKTAKMVSLRTARHPIRRAAARPLTFDLDAQLLALIYKIQQKYLHVTKLTKWQKPKNLMQVKHVEMFLKVPYYAKKKKKSIHSCLLLP